MEDVYVGPLTERLMSALAFDHEDGSGGAVWAEEKENELVEGSVEERKPSKPALDAVDLEERIKRELRFIGILGEEDVSDCFFSCSFVELRTDPRVNAAC